MFCNVANIKDKEYTPRCYRQCYRLRNGSTTFGLPNGDSKVQATSRAANRHRNDRAAALSRKANQCERKQTARQKRRDEMTGFAKEDTLRFL